MMINQTLLELARPIPPEALMHDWWIALVASAFGKIDYTPETTILYRQHGKNDTGAKKYGVRAYFNPNKTSTDKMIAQANELMKRYHQLRQEQLELIHAFIRFKNAQMIQRAYLMFKHGFQKHGFFRNIKELFFYQ